MLITRFTERVAAELAVRHGGDPSGELLVWLRTALRREASVGEMYGLANLEQRLSRLEGPRALAELAQSTIAHIWAQERAHAAYLDAILVAVARAPSLASRASAGIHGLLGVFEGWVMSGRTSPSPLARLKAGCLLAIGRRVEDVPDFVTALATMTFREYCELNAELEVTAVKGYERMHALLEQPAVTRSFPSSTALRVDVARLEADERYHYLVFSAIAGWFDPAAGDAPRAGLSLRACAAQLEEIRRQSYV